MSFINIILYTTSKLMLRKNTTQALFFQDNDFLRAGVLFLIWFLEFIRTIIHLVCGFDL